MYDAPFRVERTVRSVGNGDVSKTHYAIARTGDGEVCWTEDVTLAYRLVELLNEESHARDVHR